MLFSSITFLYFFLPVVLLLYAVTPKTAKNLTIFIASCLFYAWGEPLAVFLMLFQIVSAYILTLMMEKRRDSRTGRILYILAVSVPFASLIYFKYSYFLWSNLNLLSGGMLLEHGIVLKEKVLPIGISFYTFQIVSYIIDVHRGRVAQQKNILTLAAYISLFPQLIAGPIVRYSDIAQQMESRQVSAKGFADGIVRFSTGLGKKVLIANLLGEFVAEAMTLQERSVLLSWGYALAVALQIYFDFSGYSDMAIGLGRMFGFSFPENFRYPFIAGSLSEFWRRWHMTLGSWFRDYVYIPLGGNRVSYGKWIRNIVIVWFLTGFWHGAGWNYIVWGMFFAVFLIMEKLMGKLLKSQGKIRILLLAGRHFYVVLCILVSFLIFHAKDMTQAWADIRSLWSASALWDTLTWYYLRNRLGILMLAIVGATPLPAWLYGRLQEVKYLDKAWSFVRIAGVFAILVLSTAYLVDGSFNPFLYFQF